MPRATAAASWMSARCRSSRSMSSSSLAVSDVPARPSAISAEARRSRSPSLRATRSSASRISGSSLSMGSGPRVFVGVVVALPASTCRNPTRLSRLSSHQSFQSWLQLVGRLPRAVLRIGLRRPFVRGSVSSGGASGGVVGASPFLCPGGGGASGSPAAGAAEAGAAEEAAWVGVGPKAGAGSSARDCSDPTAAAASGAGRPSAATWAWGQRSGRRRGPRPVPRRSRR